MLSILLFHNQDVYIKVRNMASLIQLWDSFLIQEQLFAMSYLWKEKKKESYGIQWTSIYRTIHGIVSKVTYVEGTLYFSIHFPVHSVEIFQKRLVQLGKTRTHDADHTASYISGSNQLVSCQLVVWYDQETLKIYMCYCVQLSAPHKSWTE